MHETAAASRAPPGVIVPCSFTVNDHTAATKRPENVTIDIIFPTATKVARIIFKNSYAASVTVRYTTDRAVLLRKERDNLDGWDVMVPGYTLMEHPLVETEAQLWHSLTSKHFASGSADTPVVGLRLYLRQPAVHWKSISLKHVQVHTYASAAAPSGASSGKEAALQEQLAKSKAVSWQIEALASVGCDLFAACNTFGAREIPSRRRPAAPHGGPAAGDT